MKISVATTDRPIITEGSHTLTLTACSAKRVKSQYSRHEDGMVDKLLWTFRSATRDTAGIPYEYACWTNLQYGSDKASLTSLVDMLVPGITHDSAACLDTDELIGKKWRGRIVHKPSSSGTLYANHTYLDPVEEVPASSTVTPPENDKTEIDWP